MMSPGFTADPLGMFSVAGITASRLIRSSSFAIAETASSTAAAPDISIFISCIEAAGLIEIPPVSKVTPLPTSPRVSPRPRPRMEDDQSRLLLGPLRNGDQAAHLLLGDLLAAEDLAADRCVLVGDRLGAARQIGR